MTCSSDRTVKFWDTRSAIPMAVIYLPERCSCAAVDYPMAAIATANPVVIVYNLVHGPIEFMRQKTPLNYDHRAISIFRDQEGVPIGYAVSNIEGYVAIQHVNASDAHKAYNFMCNRAMGSLPHYFYPVNDLVFHPTLSTLATAGSDGIYNYWDTEGHIGMKYSNTTVQSITKCAMCTQGHRQ